MKVGAKLLLTENFNFSDFTAMRFCSTFTNETKFSTKSQEKNAG